MRSIQGRLTLWLVSSVLVLFGLHWLVTSHAPVVITEEYVATRLQHDGETLLPGISFDAIKKPVIDAYSIAPIYTWPRSGHYFILETDDHRLRSQSLGEEDIAVPWPARDERMLMHIDGPYEEPLLVWLAHFQHEGIWIRLAIAEEMTALNRHLNKFRLRFGLVTLFLLLVFIATQRLIVKRSLKPLQEIASACRDLEAGSIEALPESAPTEIQPLVKEINRLAMLMRQRLQRSRNAVGNLAHSLKTPLALLTQILDRPPGSIGQEEFEQAKESAGMIGSIIDRELKRARLAGMGSGVQSFSLYSEVTGIVDLLRKVHAEKDLHFEVRIDRKGLVYGDREDMLELVGNLMENASKWAAGKVRFTAVLKDQLYITVEDDGPGIDADLRDRLTDRGVRADESKTGHGLGLSIVKDVVTQYRGRILFRRSKELGGLSVEIHLPTATNCRE